MSPILRKYLSHKHNQYVNKEFQLQLHELLNNLRCNLHNIRLKQSAVKPFLDVWIKSYDTVHSQSKLDNTKAKIGKTFYDLYSQWSQFEE